MNFSRKYVVSLLIAFLLWSICIGSVVAQQNAFGNNFQFELVVTTKQAKIAEPVYVSVSDTALYKVFDHFNKTNPRYLDTRPKNSLLLGVKLNPSLTQFYSAMVPSVSKDYASFLISDSSDVVLVAMGINKNNVGDYRYHVVENDSLEIVPWSAIPRLEQHYGARQPYGFLGKYNAPGKRIMIEVVNKKDYSIRDAIIFDWRVNYRPVLKQIAIEAPGDYFNLSYHARNHGYATKFDQLTGAPLDFKFPQDSVGGITLQFKKQETLVHAVFLIKNIDGKRDTTKLGFVDNYGYFELRKELYNVPGKYDLVIKKQEKVDFWDEKQLWRMPFEVTALPFMAQRLSIIQLLPWIAGLIIILGVVFVIYRYFHRRKLAQARQERAAVQFKLKAVRAQLNPHFLFNALTSIQNLMNKKDLLEANHYLAKFAGLTRTVLNTSEQELISLDEELKIVEDYLQMEQLRFGFQYQLAVAAGLSRANTEVPAMLLQPFIENAVKHGVANMEKQGLIVVKIGKSGHDLVLTVEDNGPGFAAGTGEGTHQSFGLKLSKDRIDLLNKIYKEQPANLEITSVAGKTIITITLTGWV